MSVEEILENIEHFTQGMDTPRSRPCDTLVLSGVGVACRPDTPQLAQAARNCGMQHIVLHAGVEDLEALPIEQVVGLVDRLVVPVQPASGSLMAAGRAIAVAVDSGLHVHTNTVLSASALPELEATARVLARAKPHSSTFTYPFPVNGDAASNVPPPPRVVAALQEALVVLDREQLEVTLKGLPACHLGVDAHRLRRSSNRYYVDADHQLDRALLFFPDVVSFHKDEVCRFCSRDDSCDGFFATYLRRPGFPPLRPLD